MKTKLPLSLALLALAGAHAGPATQTTQPSVSGHYLEARTCDVYTGPCFANAEMGLAGKECLLVWSVSQGSWQGESLAGLTVIAAVRANDTLGDLRYQERRGQAVLVVDAKANVRQRQALADLAKSMAGGLIQRVVEVKVAPIQADIGNCRNNGCARVTAGTLVNISTRCLGAGDHLCGNEEAYYPPLLPVQSAQPAFTEWAAFTGKGLNLTWQSAGQRSTFIAPFAR